MIRDDSLTHLTNPLSDAIFGLKFCRRRWQSVCAFLYRAFMGWRQWRQRRGWHRRIRETMTLIMPALNEE